MSCSRIRIFAILLAGVTFLLPGLFVTAVDELCGYLLHHSASQWMPRADNIIGIVRVQMELEAAPGSQSYPIMQAYLCSSC